MNQQKGFSLIEVLISLMLVTSLGLGLITLLGQTKQLFIHLIQREQASQYLDFIDESLSIGIDKIPVPPEPYHFSLKKNKAGTVLQIDWLNALGTIKRYRPFISTV